MSYQAWEVPNVSPFLLWTPSRHRFVPPRRRLPCLQGCRLPRGHSYAVHGDAGHQHKRSVMTYRVSQAVNAAALSLLLHTGVRDGSPVGGGVGRDSEAKSWLSVGCAGARSGGADVQKARRGRRHVTPQHCPPSTDPLVHRWQALRRGAKNGLPEARTTKHTHNLRYDTAPLLPGG